MKEIGGYIEFEYFSNAEYHQNAIALNSGRHCVEYLIRAKHIQKIYIPYFMCDSVSNLCGKLGVDVEYYHINKDFVPLFDLNLSNGEFLYIVNFYGQLSNELICQFKEKYRNIIIDNTQAFFEKSIAGVDTCYTCRKFFGVSDGGYLYTDCLLNDELPVDYSYDRMGFLFGRMDKTASEFYSQYTKNNERFADEPLKQMSKVTRNIMRGIDYDRVKQIRSNNFETLHKSFKKINRLDLVVPPGAFMYPLYIENGAEIRNKLQQNKIYIPTLWPDVFDICDVSDLEYDMAMNILPLPVDQRYTKEDMEYIVEELRKC